MRVASSLVLLLALASPATADAPAAPPLDYEFFKTQVQPIFLAKRPATRAASRATARARRCACSRSPPGERPGPTRSRARTSTRSGGWSCPGSVKSRLLDASARRTGRRRLLSQRRQALELAERPRVADDESVGDGRDARRQRTPSADHPDQQRRRQRPRHRSRRPTRSSA